MSAVKRLVAALRGRSLKLRVGDTSESFASPEELGLFLKARLAVPDERMQEFAKLDERALQREARKMLQAHQNVMDVMVGAKETGELLGNLWRRLDISKVPDDHDWPSILFAVGNDAHIIEAYRREALSLYLQYLENRRDALDSFRPHQERRKGGERSITAASPKEPARDSGPPPSEVLEGFARLPHCHAVEVKFEDKPDITVFLGTNRYHLSKQGEALTLMEDKAGNAYPLKPGRNTIGRSSQCDVHLGNHVSNVSRQHLVVDVSGNRSVNLMDVSSRGTYVRPERLAAPADNSVTGQAS
jgi:hypothetical protein